LLLARLSRYTQELLSLIRTLGPDSRRRQLVTRMIPKSVSLSVQLLLTLVGLVVITTVVLTVSAYRSFRDDLENDARRLVRGSAEQMAGTVTRLIEQRQERARGFLSSVESLCGEQTSKGRTAWELGCVGQALAEFRATERARGALFRYGDRDIARAGERPRPTVSLSGSFADLVPHDDGYDYIIRATSGFSVLTVEFSVEDLDALFREHAVLGAFGEIFLTDAAGHFLTTPRYGGRSVPQGATLVEPIADCLEGASELTSIDYRGVNTIHGIRPVPSFLGGACVDAHLASDEALAPAVTLRDQLVNRGTVFVLIGVLLSLIASNWIASPVRRLALSARALEDGNFGRPIPIAGPSEIRALAQGFAKMARAVADLITREQVARREAEAANRMKDDFLATVSHELRNPLTSILGWAHLLRWGGLSGESAERAIIAVERAANAQNRLVEDLLDVSRIVAGRLEIDRSVVSPVEPLHAALEAIRPDAARRRLHVQLEIERDSPAVLGDPQRLQQIVSNLLTNAVKFTPLGGRIIVRLKRVGDQVELSVSDTGIGIAPEFLPHVFERFQQAASDAREVRSGLGIGLAIVQQLVRLHGGRVSVASEGLGRGSTFTVTLPIADGAVNSLAVTDQPPLASAPQPRRLEAVRVLLIDDDQETLRVVRAMLENAGARVETALSAAEARSRLSVFHPTVLVSDIAMPMEDGLAFLRSLRASQLTVPAIALTARARRGDADEARAAGFNMYMQKPVQPESLVNAVASLAATERPH
jgi:signal transduction histidine kinase/CheY-like chemotaxis protein